MRKQWLAVSALAASALVIGLAGTAQAATSLPGVHGRGAEGASVVQDQATATSDSRRAGSAADARKGRSGLGSLVRAGTITKAQAIAVREALHAAKAAGAVRATVLQQVLSALVADETVTQVQADAIAAARSARGTGASAQESTGTAAY